MAVFLAVGIVGLVVVAASLLFGEAIDGLLDFDVLGGDLFSLASIAAFLGAFGFGGLISLGILDVIWIAVITGLIAGSIAAWGATTLTRWLKRAETEGQFRSDQLIGATARVITAIPEQGYGEVIVLGSGGSRKRSARADVPIPAGAEVWVSAILSPTAVEVASVEALPPITTES